MNRQQGLLLQMLKEIHGICERNGITYYLAMGSLIGAVRHGGFLPWDDDADVIMTLDNFRRFKKACEYDIPENRALRSPDENEDFCFLLPRYVSCETTAIHKSQSLHDGDVCGEVIDIFILDPIADGHKAYLEWATDVNLYSELRNYANACSTRFELPREIYDKFAAIREEKGAVYVSRLMEERLARNFSPEGRCYGFRWNGAPVTMDRSYFEETTLVDFEDAQFLAPKDIYGFLTSFYGEEWALIPENITATKHSTASSHSFSYTEALTYYRPTYNRAKLRNDVEARKRSCMDAATRGNDLSDEVAWARAKIAQLELERKIAANREEFDSALAVKDGRALASLLESYLNSQLSPELSGRHTYKGYFRYLRPIMIDVEDDVFEAALVALMSTERIARASRLLEMREWLGIPLNDGAARIKELRDDFRAAVSFYQNHRYAEGMAIVDSLLDALPDANSFHKLRCVFLGAIADESKREDDICRLSDAAIGALALFPQDGFFLKIKADCDWLKGACEEATEKYLVAANKTRNGFALLDIFEKTGYYPDWYRKPRWAKSYGVKQWDGVEPALDNVTSSVAAAPSDVGVSGDVYQRKLLDMLLELCALCEAARVDYALLPNCSSMLAEGVLPSKMGDFGIVCTPEGFDTLKRVAGDVENRSLVTSIIPSGVFSSENTKSLLSWWLYCADDTVFLDFSAKKAPAASTFAVSIAVLKHADDSVREASSFVVDDAHLRAFSNALEPRSGANVTGRLELPANCAVSLDVGYRQLLESGVWDEGYYERRSAYRKDLAKARKAQKCFRENFEQIKLAVALKEVSLQLLPIKEQIKSAADEGDTNRVEELLAPYISIVRKYAGVGNLTFDDEIYQTLKMVCETA